MFFSYIDVPLHIILILIDYHLPLFSLKNQRLADNWKSLGNKTFSRSKMRWEDDVINDLKKMKVKNLKITKEVNTDAMCIIFSA